MWIFEEDVALTTAFARVAKAFRMRLGRRILCPMGSVASRYHTMLADLSRRVPLVCTESWDGKYVHIGTKGGVSVATLSRAIAIEAGINPDSLRAMRSQHKQCVEHQGDRVPSVSPIQWQHPSTALAALKPLLERDGGLVENLIVRLSRNPRFPQRGPRYRMADYVVLSGAGVFIDVVRRHPLYANGWISAASQNVEGE